MSAFTATTGPALELDSQRLQEMVEAMAAAGKPTWTLISPCGRVWVDDQRAIARVLFQNIDVTTLFKDHP